MTGCKESIIKDGKMYQCNKDEHRDALWHKSKPVRTSLPVSDQTHVFILLVATWRVERK